MRMHVGVAGLLFVTCTALQAQESKPAPAKGEARAAALLAAAARTRYTWSPEVTAVSGKVTWNVDGASGAGTFQDVLHRRGGFKIMADGGATVPDEVSEHIQSLIGHRTPLAAGATNRPAAPAVIVVEDDAHGPLIMMVGDRMQSTERVKDGKLVQVNRRMAGKRFTIDVTRFVDAGQGRVYPADFTVTWWNAATGKRLEKQTYTTHGFYNTDGQMFPKAETVVSDKAGTISKLQLRYSDIKFDMGRAAAR
ncbi:MAG TPA: DUF3386 family protein [Gemmataceae bacterium]|nr:DUF3386 family protein [Gemmataceae bacterium]